MHPGVVLAEEVMPALGLTPELLAERTGLPLATIESLLEERQDVTAEIADALQVLGMDRASWLGLQDRLNEHRAAQSSQVGD